MSLEDLCEDVSHETVVSVCAHLYTTLKSQHFGRNVFIFCVCFCVCVCTCVCLSVCVYESDSVCSPSFSRHHLAIGLLCGLLPVVHWRVHVVGMPLSHQPTRFQRALCDGGFLHSRSPGVPLSLPESLCSGSLPPGKLVG